MPEEPARRSVRLREQYLLLLAALLLLFALAWLLSPVLAPFLGGMLLAYMGDPLVDRLAARGLPRLAGVLLVFLLFFLLLALTLFVTLPLLIRELAAFMARLPDMLAWLQSVSQPWAERLGVDALRFDRERLQESLVSNWRELGGYTTRLLMEVTRSGFALLVFLANLVLVPVVAFYLMNDWDRFTRRLHDLLPVNMQPKAAQLARECDEVLGAFLRGQLLIMLCLGVFYTLGLSLAGLDSAMVTGLVSGIFALVPFLGTVLGVGIATLAAFTQSGEWSLLFAVWGVYVLGQLLEGYVLTPILVGDRLGLHPVAVIFAVLAGGQLFGITGVLLALPVAAMIVVFLRHIHEVYKDSSLYTPSLPERAAPPEDAE